MDRPGVGADPAGTGRDRILAEAEYDWSATAPSIAVVEVIASIEGLDPAALSRNGGFTLNEYVDAEALDRLVADDRATELSIVLTVNSYAVRIEGSTVTVLDSVTDHGPGPSPDPDPDSTSTSDPGSDRQ